MNNNKINDLGYYLLLVLTTLVWGGIIAISFTSCGGADAADSYYVSNSTNCEQSIFVQLTPEEAAKEEAEGDLVGYLDTEYSEKELGQTATISAEVCTDENTTIVEAGNNSDGDTSINIGAEK